MSREVIIKTESEISRIRTAGALLSRIIDETANSVVPGMTSREIDAVVHNRIISAGAKPALLGYNPPGISVPFPATACISFNEEVVHGIPGDRIVKSGDIVSLDCVLWLDGVYADYAITFGVGEISKEATQLLFVCKSARSIGIEAIKTGKHSGRIGEAIENYIGNSYGIVTEFAGHGVGREIHEYPYIPNFKSDHKGPALVAGMVIAVEPMIMIGGEKLKFHTDHYTVSTKDKSLSAHFEHTVIITEHGPEIATQY